MTKKVKLIFGANIIFVSFLLFCYAAYADSVSLYANIDDSSSQCNLLVDTMKNDPGYDPYNEFVVLRAGERDYRIYFGPDVLNSVAIYYRYTTSYQQQPASLVRGSTNGSLNITDNGYYYVGNIEGSLASSQAESYKLGVVVTTAAVIIVLLILFKMFRKGSGTKAKYYKVR